MKKLEKLIALLKKKKLTLSIAESCTAGFASYLLTKIPGSSKVYKGGIIVYSLESKNKFFSISPALLKKSQGVSKEIAEKLASKVRRKFNSDIGLSIVGFAGPETKKGVNVGTTFIGLSFKNKTTVKKHILKDSRDTIRKKASHLLIDLIYEILNYPVGEGL